MNNKIIFFRSRLTRAPPYSSDTLNHVQPPSQLYDNLNSFPLPLTGHNNTEEPPKTHILKDDEMHLLAQQSPSARNVRAVRRAFLNVDTMRQLRLAAGDHVLIQAQEGVPQETQQGGELSPVSSAVGAIGRFGVPSFDALVRVFPVLTVTLTVCPFFSIARVAIGIRSHCLAITHSHRKPYVIHGILQQHSFRCTNDTKLQEREHGKKN